MGRKYMGISRWTFVLNKDHKIIKIYDKVKPAEHSQEVLEFIRNN
jgi:peroxiredoxin Q/BCP